MAKAPLPRILRERLCMAEVLAVLDSLVCDIFSPISYPINDRFRAKHVLG